MHKKTYHIACNCNIPSHRSHGTARYSTLQPAVSTVVCIHKAAYNMYLNSVSGFVYDTLYDTFQYTSRSNAELEIISPHLSVGGSGSGTSRGRGSL